MLAFCVLGNRNWTGWSVGSLSLSLFRSCCSISSLLVIPRPVQSPSVSRLPLLHPPPPPPPPPLAPPTNCPPSHHSSFAPVPSSLSPHFHPFNIYTSPRPTDQPSDKGTCKQLTQPHLTNRRLLLRFGGLFLLRQALDFRLGLAALGRFGLGESLVCAALLGGLDLFGEERGC